MCRDDKTEVLGWFGKEREIEFVPSEQLLVDSAPPLEMPDAPEDDGGAVRGDPGQHDA